MHRIIFKEDPNLLQWTFLILDFSAPHLMWTVEHAIRGRQVSTPSVEAKGNVHLSAWSQRMSKSDVPI